MSETIVITAATHTELSLLLKSMGGRTVETSGGFPLWESVSAAGRVVLAVTGMGKINAAAAAAVLCERYHPTLMVNTGCAGAYPGSGLKVGDLALASMEISADEGVLTSTGWLSYEGIGIAAVERQGIRYFNEFPLSPAACGEALRLAGNLGVTLASGRFITVSTCSGTAESGKELFDRFGAPLCENMEGAAVAQVALRYGVEALELRGVSNLVEERDLSRWNIPLAVARAQQFLLKFIAARCEE
jgi:futalosine hydrolase